VQRQQYDHVKLHATLLNSLFRDDGDDRRTTFDASDLLKQYGSFCFGNMLLSDIHLSQRYSTGSNGFYEASAIIKM
jgi:activating signal cointegrator complex subunit 1